jgi:hypothetical protein
LIGKQEGHPTANPQSNQGLVTYATGVIDLMQLSDQPACDKMWKRELIQDIELRSTGFEFCLEVTTKVLRRGITIPEMPIPHRPRRIEEG